MSFAATLKKKNKESAAWLLAIGDPTRLAIIQVLTQGSKNVTEIAKMLDVEIVNISHHLGVMKVGGLVSDEKHGRFVNYSLKAEIVSSTTATEITITNPDTGLSLTVPF